MMYLFATEAAGHAEKLRGFRDASAPDRFVEAFRAQTEYARTSASRATALAP
jgi:hypothetical protein